MYAIRSYYEVDVFAVEARHEFGGIPERQGLSDVGANLFRRGGGQGETDRTGREVAYFGKGAVFRPKVVAPLGDAVRLVDGEAIDSGLGEEFPGALVGEAFRGEVQKLHGSRAYPLDRGEVGLAVQRAIEEGGFHAARDEGVHLILHEGDQGRDHHGHAGKREGGYLIAQGLAAARA